MNSWIKLDNSEYGLLSTQTENGVAFKIFVSAYNVPEAVRGFINSSGNCCIEFRYLSGNEEHTVTKRQDDLTLHVGKSSYRIYRIEFSANGQTEQVVQLELVQALSRFDKSFRRPAGFGNYDVNRAVIERQYGEISKDLAPS